MVDAIYSNGRKLRMVGAKKPDSEFVKQMVTHKDILAMHMPTVSAPTQSGDEKHLEPTEEALQEFEKQKSESTITAKIPQWATDGYQKALDFVNESYTTSRRTKIL